MIRKLFLAALVAAGLLGGMTLTASADPGFPQIGGLRPIAIGERNPNGGGHHHHHVRFQVLIRHGHHWDAYRTFHDRDDARRAAWRLERQGYDAKITPVHDH